MLNIRGLSRLYLVAAGCAVPVLVHVAMCLMQLRGHYRWTIQLLDPWGAVGLGLSVRIWGYAMGIQLDLNVCLCHGDMLKIWISNVFLAGTLLVILRHHPE